MADQRSVRSFECIDKAVTLLVYMFVFPFLTSDETARAQ